MKKLNQTQLLNIFALLFVIVIGLGLISLRSDDLKYQLSVSETLEKITENSVEMIKEEAQQLLENTSPSVKYIDIRSTEAFLKGHKRGALNIPINKLVNPENRAFLKDTAYTIVLYSQDQEQAYGAKLLFQQLGMNHIKFMPANYDPVADTFSFAEYPKYDYQKVFSETREANNRSATKASALQPKKIRILPKPVQKVEVEEEEGC